MRFVGTADSRSYAPRHDRTPASLLGGFPQTVCVGAGRAARVPDRARSPHPPQQRVFQRSAVGRCRNGLRPASLMLSGKYCRSSAARSASEGASRFKQSSHVRVIGDSRAQCAVALGRSAGALPLPRWKATPRSRSSPRQSAPATRQDRMPQRARPVGTMSLRHRSRCATSELASWGPICSTPLSTVRAQLRQRTRNVAFCTPYSAWSVSGPGHDLHDYSGYGSPEQCVLGCLRVSLNEIDVSFGFSCHRLRCYCCVRIEVESQVVSWLSDDMPHHKRKDPFSGCPLIERDEVVPLLLPAEPDPDLIRYPIQVQVRTLPNQHITGRPERGIVLPRKRGSVICRIVPATSITACRTRQHQHGS